MEGVLWQGMSFELPPNPNHPFPITPNPLGFHHCCLLGLLQPVLGRNETFWGLLQPLSSPSCTEMRLFLGAAKISWVPGVRSVCVSLGNAEFALNCTENPV